MIFIVILAFLAGLAIGLLIAKEQKRAWQKYLIQLLQELFGSTQENVSSSLSNRLRREILLLKSHSSYLQKQLNLWQNLMEKAPIGYLQVDEENQLIWCNQKARDLLQLDRWQPNQVRLLLELVRSYELDQLIEETRNTQESQVQEWVFHSTDFSQETATNSSDQSYSSPTSIALKGSSYPLAEKNVGVFLENQQPLKELSQQNHRLFSDLTHELRTPLTSIRLVAETLQPRLQAPENRWVNQMLQEANRLIRLIEDWLEISQLEKKPQQNLRKEQFAIAPLIYSAWETLKPLSEQKQLQFNYESKQPLLITADYSRLTQVFLNLFDNAIKYSPPNRNIWVKVVFLPSHRIDKPEDWVQISVIDQGQGLSKTDILRVFDRLYRGDEGAEERKKNQVNQTDANSSFQSSGTGLGLAITRQIILAHGGRIQAKNHPETGGAWLQIELPNVTSNVT